MVPAVPRVRNLQSYWLQDLRAVQELGSRGPQRPLASTLASREQAGLPGRAGDPRDQEGVPLLGGSQDPREAAPRVPDDQAAGGQHGARRARSEQPRQAPQAPPPTGQGHRAACRPRAQRPVVRGLQGRVHARQQAVLLSADDHRLPLALSARLRGTLLDSLSVRLLGVRKGIQGFRLAGRDPHRQWRSLRLCQCPLWPLEACGLVVERQHWMPPVRTNPVELAASRLLGRVLLRRRWASCQALVCRRADSR